MNLLEAIPNLREAIERERVSWNAAFLPVAENLAGFDASPLTLRRYLILRLMRTPLLRGEIPSPEELAAFLWAVSPDYQPDAPVARKRFFRRCRREFTKPGRAAAVMRAAMEYIAGTFADRPGGSAAEGTEYYCDACFLCAAFAREFGWDDEVTLEKPLNRIFQYLKELRRHHNPKAPLFKPSDRLVNAWLEQKNAKPAAN